MLARRASATATLWLRTLRPVLRQALVLLLALLAWQGSLSLGLLLLLLLLLLLCILGRVMLSDCPDNLVHARKLPWPPHVVQEGAVVKAVVIRGVALCMVAAAQQSCHVGYVLAADGYGRAPSAGTPLLAVQH